MTVKVFVGFINFASTLFNFFCSKLFFKLYHLSYSVLSPVVVNFGLSINWHSCPRTAAIWLYMSAEVTFFFKILLNATNLLLQLFDIVLSFLLFLFNFQNLSFLNKLVTLFLPLWTKIIYSFFLYQHLKLLFPFFLLFLFRHSDCRLNYLNALLELFRVFHVQLLK